GVNANIPIDANISIEPGLYYTQKGYDLKGDFGIKGIEFLGANAKASLITQYIDLPVLLKGNFGGLLIFAGPQVSYLAQANLKTTAGVLGINILNKTIDASGQFNRWDAGVTGGIGYQFTNGMNIMASYDYGLMKVDANQTVNAYNRAIKIGIGVNF
ncbi:MAG: porin family protein, partial [Ginsengibacter sp.]